MTIFDRLDRNSIIPDDPGNEIKINHLDETSRKKLNTIFEKYEEAFARDKYNCGTYNRVLVKLDLQEGKTVFQKEGPMKESDKAMVRDII